MISDISPAATVKLDASGNGQVSLGPPSGTKWALRLATVAVSTAGVQPQAYLYRGSSSGPLELIDSTSTGAAASSGKVAGAPFFPGQLLWAVWKSGDPLAVATLQVYGQQGARSDPLAPGPPAEGFASPVVLELQVGPASPNARAVITSNIPAVLTAWGTAHNVTFGMVELFYLDATEFVFRAVGQFQNKTCEFEGTYDTINGVYILKLTIPSLGNPSAVETQFGSYAVNGFQELWTTQQIKLRIGDGTQTNDLLQVNCDEEVLGNVYKILNGSRETWNGLFLLNNFVAKGAGFPALSVRRLASPPNEVELVGTIVSGVTVATGTSIAQVGTDYRPTTQQGGAAINFQGAGGQVVLAVIVGSNGIVSLWGTWANGASIYINMRYPLDL